MSDGSGDVSRRGFLRTAAGGAAGSVAVGTATAQEDGGNQTGGNETGGGNQTGGGGGGQSLPPDYQGWFSNVDNYAGETQDMRNQSTVTVEVGTQGNGGPNAFSPPAIHVDVGTTVQFEWTGDGVHNVVEEGGGYSSGGVVGEAGVNFEHTYEEAGISKYYCEPHRSNGMKGAVVVGDDFPTVQPSGPSGPQIPEAATSLGIGAAVVMLATLGMAWVFIKFGGDYPGED